MNISTVLSGSDTLTKAGTGTLGLNTANTFTGKFVVTGGLLGINTDAALGAVPTTFEADSITLDGGGLVAGVNFTSPVNFSKVGSVSLDANRGITLGAGGGTFRVGFGTDVMTVNGVISGAGALTKIDSGTLVLNGDNTYQGATSITGILQVGTGGTTGTMGAGKITFGSGNSNFLNFDRTDSVVLNNDIGTGTRANFTAIAGETVTLNGAITGTGEFWVHGTGTVVVNANANTSRTTSTVIESGMLQVSDLTRTASSALGSGSIFFGQSTTPSTGAGLSYTGDSVSTDAFQNIQTPNAFIEVTNPNTVLSATSLFKGIDGTDLLTKTGAGTFSLEGIADNTRMRLQVNEGTLQLGKTSSSSVHAVGGTNALILNNGTIRITGTGGDQIFDNSSIQINGGTFDLNGQSEALNILTSNASNGVITNQVAGTTSTLTLGTNNGTSLYTGKLQDDAGAMALQKIGTGSLTLTGVNTFTGGTSVTNGRLIVSGSLTGSLTQVSGGVLGGTGTIGDITVFGGKISPGATAAGAGIGKLKTGSLDMSTSGTFEVAISTSTLESSMAEIEGDLSLGFSAATLSLTDIGTATALANGTQFTIMSYTGTWDGGTFLFGSSDIADDTTFTFGLNTYRLDYDAASGIAGINDVVLTVIVPEPNTMSVLLLGGVGLLAGWRRRRKADNLNMGFTPLPS